MSVEQLIERLNKMPFHYEVRIFCPGVEIRDFETDVVDVEVDPFTKNVLLEFQPLPGIQTGMAI